MPADAPIHQPCNHPRRPVGRLEHVMFRVRGIHDRLCIPIHGRIDTRRMPDDIAARGLVGRESILCPAKAIARACESAEAQGRKRQGGLEVERELHDFMPIPPAPPTCAPKDE